jgi:hypothetical protein
MDISLEGEKEEKYKEDTGFLKLVMMHASLKKQKKEIKRHHWKKAHGRN